MSNRQEGVAVVLAMAVVALATIAATGILVTQAAWVRQGELTADHARAQALAKAGVEWARAILGDDRRAGVVDHPAEAWASPLQPAAMEGSQLTGSIEDQQGKYNLNNLVQGGIADQEQVANFQRLLALLGLSPALAGSLVDWLDADGELQAQGGAEDPAYLALQPPYLAANRPLADLGELALVRGFDEGVRARLQPYVCVLPRRTPVNVNTAVAEVLAAMVEGLGVEGARELLRRRASGYFANLDDFLRDLPDGVTAGVEDLSFGSDFFLASVQARVGTTEARSVALLDRTEAGWPAVVWRKGP